MVEQCTYVRPSCSDYSLKLSWYVMTYCNLRRITSGELKSFDDVVQSLASTWCIELVPPFRNQKAEAHRFMSVGVYRYCVDLSLMKPIFQVVMPKVVFSDGGYIGIL